MKLITVMELKEGMELAENVENNGQIVFSEHTIVDEIVINRIKRYGIMCVSIMEAVDYARTHNEAIQFDENFKKFCTVYDEQLVVYKAVFISYLQTLRSIDSSVLMSIYQTVADTIQTEKQLLDYIYNKMPNEDELTYTQSFNAALLCGAFANWLGLSADDKKMLILCGFYYDIGKWNISPDILWKPGKLTDEEFALVKKHPVTGYALVRNDPALSDSIKNTIIMHHERYDGSGYPYHMVGDKIELFARYIAIVDTYIAMASPRAFRNAFTPLQILGTFENSVDKYDAAILFPIMQKIADTQIGVKVQLNDESVWEVIMIQNQSYSRPILKSDFGEILDLSTRPDLSVVKLV